jgi:hypothetical protein
MMVFGAGCAPAAARHVRNAPGRRPFTTGGALWCRPRLPWRRWVVVILPWNHRHLVGRAAVRRAQQPRRPATHAPCGILADALRSALAAEAAGARLLHGVADLQLPTTPVVAVTVGRSRPRRPPAATLRGRSMELIFIYECTSKSLLYKNGLALQQSIKVTAK